jgi:hypothetical protein
MIALDTPSEVTAPAFTFPPAPRADKRIPFKPMSPAERTAAAAKIATAHNARLPKTKPHADLTVPEREAGALPDTTDEGGSPPPVARDEIAPSPYPTKLDAALDAKRRGFKVFPLREYVDPGPDASEEERLDAIKSAKKPRVGFDNWPNRATTDEKQIEEWWTRWPNANVGGTMGGLIAVDVDLRKNGDASFRELDASDGFPDTLRTMSWSGGNHNVYTLPDHTHVSNSANVFAPGIDIKSGHGAYLVMPGSTIEGREYRWANDLPPTLCPPWIIDRCKKSKEKSANAGKRLIEENEYSLSFSADYLLKHAPTAQVGNRGFTAYKVGTRLYDFGVYKETCAAFLARHPACGGQRGAQSSEAYWLRQSSVSGLRSLRNACDAARG